MCCLTAEIYPHPDSPVPPAKPHTRYGRTYVRQPQTSEQWLASSITPEVNKKRNQLDQQVTRHASAVNRTRGPSMATTDFTTKPLMRCRNAELSNTTPCNKIANYFRSCKPSSKTISLQQVVPRIMPRGNARMYCSTTTTLGLSIRAITMLE